MANAYMANASLEVSLFLVFVSRSVCFGRGWVEALFRRAIASNMELP